MTQSNLHSPVTPREFQPVFKKVSGNGLPSIRYETVSNPRWGWSGAPTASPGPYTTGPKWSNIKNGSHWSMRSPIGLRTKNPPPSLICRDFSMRSTPRATTILFCVLKSLGKRSIIVVRLFSLVQVPCTCRKLWVVYICQLSLTRDALRAENDLADILRCHEFLIGEEVTENCSTSEQRDGRALAWDASFPANNYYAENQP